MVLIQWMLMIISVDATFFPPASNPGIKQGNPAIKNTNMSFLESIINELGQEIMIEEPIGVDFNQQRLPGKIPCNSLPYIINKKKYGTELMLKIPSTVLISITIWGETAFIWYRIQFYIRKQYRYLKYFTDK